VERWPVAIKHALLGLLAEGAKHGYELKTAFDETIGERWSLNIGQVYNTLNRLTRDGYVVLQEEVEQETRPDKKIYAITEAGREELFRWLAEPVEKPRRLKDEFYIKLVLCSELGYGDLRDLIWNQRWAYLQLMRMLREAQSEINAEDDPFTVLLIEGGILHVEADLHWLDRCEEMLGTE
jgi:DNA-binding PadR family transcriptional regulator